MSERATQQSAASHARYVPGYHFVAAILAVINVVWSARRALTHPGGDNYLALVAAVALVLVAWYARQFPLAVQDRLIRLEERLRLARILPADLQAHAESLTASQLIALRFASDAELPELVRKITAEGVDDRAKIKGMIREWRPDHMRA